MSDTRPSTNAARPQRLAEALAESRALYREMHAPDALAMPTLAQMRAARERAIAMRKTTELASTKQTSRATRWLHALTANRWTAALSGSLATIALATVSAPLWIGYLRESVEVATPFMLVNDPQSAQLDVSQMVRVNVTREAMLDFGIPVPPQRLQEAVKAEMLMGQRGELLAVRFVEPKPDQRWRWQLY